MRTAFPSFFSFPLSFFFRIKAGFFGRCEGHDHWFHCSSVPDGHKHTSLQSSLKSCSKLWAKADAQLKRRRYALLHFRVSPPHPAFFKNTSKEFIIVFKTNVIEHKRPQWNFDLRKGQGIDKILGLPNDSFLLNSLETLFSVRTQSTFRFLEMHSKRRYKICICSVILGKL